MLYKKHSNNTNQPKITFYDYSHLVLKEHLHPVDNENQIVFVTLPHGHPLESDHLTNFGSVTVLTARQTKVTVFL